MKSLPDADGSSVDPSGIKYADEIVRKVTQTGGRLVVVGRARVAEPTQRRWQRRSEPVAYGQSASPCGSTGRRRSLGLTDDHPMLGLFGVPYKDAQRSVACP